MILFPSPGSEVGIKRSTAARSSAQEEEAVSSVYVCVGVYLQEIKLDIKLDINIYLFLIPTNICTQKTECAHFDYHNKKKKLVRGKVHEVHK